MKKWDRVLSGVAGAGALARLVEDAPMRREMGAAGRARAVTCFHPRTGGAQFREVIESVS